MPKLEKRRQVGYGAIPLHTPPLVEDPGLSGRWRASFKTKRRQLANHKGRYETIIQKLRDNGHKITPQRLAIVEILVKSKGHPSVEDIYGQITKDFPTMSLATVYKNIILMRSLGEVLELGFPDGSNRYDGNKPYSHPHVVCTKCKKIVDLDLESLDDMTKEVAAETHFKILNHRLDFFGICSDCMVEKA